MENGDKDDNKVDKDDLRIRLDTRPKQKPMKVSGGSPDRPGPSVKKAKRAVKKTALQIGSLVKNSELPKREIDNVVAKENDKDEKRRLYERKRIREMRARQDKLMEKVKQTKK